MIALIRQWGRVAKGVTTWSILTTEATSIRPGTTFGHHCAFVLSPVLCLAGR
ncbi:Uncharacterised protein [Mycobacteroides abscessus subsp. abscessus]|nr:Uncharacterised protein [Mycobacteroides abscessus subsp. abscessus]SID79860.1 Uncharacterised protein [Mycobacteroides abscessus subsp. abscessus]SIE29112.1 Uncharacterised protein [Mycobacteroides abscessus subsp. abscessus]SIJ63720.1 Uncharacterised protein [Mycobacteroides abscessus subsp. abscessus]